MLAPFMREMQLMPYIQNMDAKGVNLDMAILGDDLSDAFIELDTLDDEIGRILGRQVDVDSNADLANAIEAAGLSNGFASTAKGSRSVAKDSLINAVSDPTLLGHILVRNSLATCIRTFMDPWYKQGKKTGGILYIKWNQVRNYSDTGARTGRLSSSPNLQNVPDEWEGLHAQLQKLGYQLNRPMPRIRKYLIAAPGHILIGRDYSAQEMRLLAHFVGGALLGSLQIDPTRDIHLIAADIANITRKVAKTLGFAILYGAGIGRIAETLGCDTTTASRLKQQYLTALPEIKELQDDLYNRGRTGKSIKTLGGRLYYCEPAKEVAGRYKTFEYKLTNYLIQGSAADQTKQAMLDFSRHCSPHSRLILSVHDELVAQVHEDNYEREAELLEEAMNNSFADILDYKVISEGSIGHSYADL